MPRYKIVRSFRRVDNTLREEDAEFIEYSITPIAFETLKDARRRLEAVATEDGITILNRGLNAEKDTITVDEETGIIVTEKEMLSIIVVS